MNDERLYIAIHMPCFPNRFVAVERINVFSALTGDLDFVKVDETQGSIGNWSENLRLGGNFGIHVFDSEMVDIFVDSY